ncbi:MAG TPA: glutamine synthetase type III, partial [Baekduia sp.]|nr:glutamine synthetase type III [Baekduia sp.]
FCAAVLQAVDKHQQLLRASVANAGQDHRLGANEAPPAIISIFLGDELEGVFKKIATGKGRRTKKGFLGLGTDRLPQLPLHGGDRNRTSPFAFTGNKFEFRAAGSSMSLGFPNTVLNTIAAEAIDELTTQLEKELKTAKGDLTAAVSAVVKSAWEANSQVVFGGDNYSDEWHAEAEKRGLLNLRTTPDALPWFTNKQTVAAFEKYNVLTKRELEARYEVAIEQYATKLNIEAETAASIARTMILPAALRQAELLDEADGLGGVDQLKEELSDLTGELVTAIFVLEKANLAENQPDEEPHRWAIYMRDTVIPAMDAVRAAADRLERIVADDLWPLPKYSEMLFIK